MKFLVAVIRIVLMVITMVLYMIGYTISLIFRKHSPESAFRLRRAWCKIGNPIMGHKLIVEGESHNGPCIYMSNHRSLSDPLIQANFFDAYIIAKAEVAKIPVMHQAALITGIIYVQRDSLHSRANARNKIVELLLKGQSVLIYPEGTTSCESDTLPFRIGGFKIAAEHNIPIKPVAIIYDSQDDVWCNGSLFAHFIKQYGKRKVVAKVVIGPSFSNSDGKTLMDTSRNWINRVITSK